jgi:hypothetical protein
MSCRSMKRRARGLPIVRNIPRVTIPILEANVLSLVVVSGALTEPPLRCGVEQGGRINKQADVPGGMFEPG